VRHPSMTLVVTVEFLYGTKSTDPVATPRADLRLDCQAGGLWRILVNRIDVQSLILNTEWTLADLYEHAFGALENCYRCKPILGSNPSPSATCPSATASISDRDPTWCRSHQASRLDHGAHRVGWNRPAKPAANVRFRSDNSRSHGRQQECGIRIAFGFGCFRCGVPTPQRRKVPGRVVVKDEPVIDKRAYTLQAGLGALQPSAIPSELEPNVLNRRLTVLSQMIQQDGVIALCGGNLMADDRIDDTRCLRREIKRFASMQLCEQNPWALDQLERPDPFRFRPQAEPLPAGYSRFFVARAEQARQSGVWHAGQQASVRQERFRVIEGLECAVGCQPALDRAAALKVHQPPIAHSFRSVVTVTDKTRCSPISDL